VPEPVWFFKKIGKFLKTDKNQKTTVQSVKIITEPIEPVLNVFVYFIAKNKINKNNICVRPT
jgi:N-glycosylase/DNA lyase